MSISDDTTSYAHAPAQLAYSPKAAACLSTTIIVPIPGHDFMISIFSLLSTELYFPAVETDSTKILGANDVAF